MYLLDTDTLSNLGKQNPSPRLLERLAGTPEPLYASAVNVAEMTYGAYRSPSPSVYLRGLEDALRALSGVLFLDYEAAQVWGRLLADQERRGRHIGHFDSQIAAIALCNHLTVVTGNLSHFAQVAGLRVENWL